MPFRYLAVILLCLVLWLLPLDFRDLIRSDEGRYAELAREMWLSGDWITPHLNNLVYFEKPPLQYWMTALFYAMWEPNEWTARLWPALTGLAGIVLSWLVLKRYSPIWAMLTAGIQASMLWYVGMAHFNALDMGVAFFLQMTLLGYVVCVTTEEDQERKQASLLLGIGIAGAMLSKGLIGIVLPGMVFVVDSLWHRDRAPWGWRFQGRVWALAGAIAAPWFILVSMKHPEFPYFFFIHEHFHRFAQEGHNREGPIYYFIPILLLGLMPWTFLWLSSLKEWGSFLRSTALPARMQRIGRIFILWSVLIFAFFSASHSKLPSYIIPIFPALAALLAYSLQQRSLSAWRVPIVLTMMTSFMIAVALPLVAKQLKDDGTRESLQHYLPYGAAGLLLLGVGCIWLLWKESAQQALSDQGKNVSIPLEKSVADFFAMWAFPCVLWLAGCTVLLQGHQSFANRLSTRAFVENIERTFGHFKAEWPFYSVRMYEHTLPFYTRHTMTLVESFDEMAFGCQKEPQKCLKTVDDWRLKWVNEPKNAYAVLPPDLFTAMQKQGIPMRMMGQTHRFILVSRR